MWIIGPLNPSPSKLGRPPSGHQVEVPQQRGHLCLLLPFHGSRLIRDMEDEIFMWYLCSDILICDFIPQKIWDIFIDFTCDDFLAIDTCNIHKYPMSFTAKTDSIITDFFWSSGISGLDRNLQDGLYPNTWRFQTARCKSERFWNGLFS